MERLPGLQVWARPLSGQQSPQAVLLLNRTPQAAKIRISWEDLGIIGPAEARDLWSHRNLGYFDTEYSALVPSHGVIMLLAVPLKAPIPDLSPKVVLQDSSRDRLGIEM